MQSAPKFKKQSSSSKTTFFIGNNDERAISQIISELASECPYCGRKILYFCIERCCSDNKLFCGSCDVGDHLAHRTNELRLLLLDR